MSDNSLAVFYFPCHLATPICDPIILLHGWGCDSRSWEPLIPPLQSIADVTAIDLPGFGASAEIENFSCENVLELLIEKIPGRAILIGWSLGGMLATQLAARYPEKISRIVTLATNVKFVASPDYETAMAPSVNHQFNKNFSENPALTLKRFTGLLAQGDVNERSLLKKIRAIASPENSNANWLQALALLSILDNRAAFAQLVQPGLHLYGEMDALVPVGVAQNIMQFNSHQKIKILAETAHALHWSQPESVANTIITFLSPLDKKRIAESFSKAAHSYDKVAQLQRDVGRQLLSKLQKDNSINTVLDLGCGTGYFTGDLQQYFPQANIIGMDIAEGMLLFAREHNNSAANWLCGDAESLPLADNSIDIIFSSLALQWCNNLPLLFNELQRVLKPGGQLFFSSLGPRTLQELKAAWQQVDDYVHVNHFFEQQSLIDAMEHSGFSVSICERKPSILYFEKLSELTRELKALGAHNINRGQAHGLHGRKKIEALKAAYENFREQRLLPATYDVFYIAATASK